MQKSLKNILFKVGSYMRNSEFWFSINQYRPGIIDKRVTHTTGFCIEGFQRSGNTYFEMMFELSNPDIVLSHHVHGVANVQKAIQLNIPVIVLIREPKDAVASLLTYNNNLDPFIALSAYIQYYSLVGKLQSKYVLVQFEELISDYNKQLLKINQYFNTQFNPSELSTEDRAKVMNERQSKYPNQLSTPYPSDVKNRMNIKHKEIVIQQSNYQAAFKVYQSVLTSNSIN